MLIRDQLEDVDLSSSRHDASQSVEMDFEYKSLPTEELLEVLTKSTMRYNQILHAGGPKKEIEMVRETMKALQKEIENRKEKE